jgi:hypothetical protein
MIAATSSFKLRGDLSNRNSTTGVTKAISKRAVAACFFMMSPNEEESNVVLDTDPTII